MGSLIGLMWAFCILLLAVIFGGLGSGVYYALAAGSYDLAALFGLPLLLCVALFIRGWFL